MRVAAWNYNPAPATIKRMPAVGFRYPWRPENDLPNATWDWDNVGYGWDVDGDLNATIDQVVERLHECPILAFSNLWWWATFAAYAPKSFVEASARKHHWLLAQVLRHFRGELTEKSLAKINLAFDLEIWEKSATPTNPGFSAPNFVTGCHLLTQSLKHLGWPRNAAVANWMNFGCSHSHKSYKCGMNNRVTPNAVPQTLDGEGSWPIGYTGEFMTEAEMLDAIAACPAPTWLALHQQSPGLENILRTAKASGKVRYVTIWVGTPAVGAAQLPDPAIDQMIYEATR